MKNLVSSGLVLDAALAATLDYGDLVTDHDPDDGSHVVPGELRRFLARLRLLHGVPFSYLVPDAQLLPPESIRFFYIDRAWTDALVQGALSVGTVSSADRAQLEAVYEHIRTEVDAAERAIRRPGKKRPGGDERLEGDAGTVTGLLVRSRAVSGWPNLHVRAYARDVLEDDALTTEAESHPSRLKVLRMERLAPAVLMVLFDGVPAVVHIEEPRQGLQFGVEYTTTGGGPQRAKIHLRDNANGNLVPPKRTLDAGNSVDVPFRAGAPGVIDMTRLRETLAEKAPNSGGTLEANEYALQMLRFPYRQVFGDPANEDGQSTFELDAFKVSVALPAWRAKVVAGLAGGTP